MVGVPLEGDWIANRVRGAKIYSPNGNSLTIEDDNLGTEVGMVIHRDKLDQFLAKLAEDDGAEVRTGVTVTDLLWNGEDVGGVKIRDSKDKSNMIK